MEIMVCDRCGKQLKSYAEQTEVMFSVRGKNRGLRYHYDCGDDEYRTTRRYCRDLNFCQDCYNRLNTLMLKELDELPEKMTITLKKEEDD